MKLSVVISAFNEEEKIIDCLESVKWADEIVFVDNSSTDRTAEIAKKFTKNVFTQKNNLMLNINKNFGFTKATKDWILCIDADEIITPELKNEIINTISNNNQEESAPKGYWIPRKNIIFNKWIEHSGWYPDHQLRLFKNGFGKFAEKHVHEMIEVNGKTQKLNHPMIHNNYQSVSQFFKKTFIIYAPNEADNLIKNGYVFNWLDAVRFPFKEFLSRFFAREGYKDGLHGLVLAMLMSFYHLAVFVYLWEKKNFVEVKENMIDGLKEELKKTKKEVKYWLYTEEIEHEKNLFKKTNLKLKRKINL